MWDLNENEGSERQGGEERVLERRQTRKKTGKGKKGKKGKNVIMDGRGKGKKRKRPH